MTLNSLKGKYADTVEHFKKINAELDRYLTELSSLEFNLNPDELAVFADSLYSTGSELERLLILNAEIKRRNIKLPFEAGNTANVRNWLKKC